MDQNKRILAGLAIALGVSLITIQSCLSRKQSHAAPKSRSIKLNDIKEGVSTIPLVIIGSGPAGWSAAIYGARANLKTLVIAGAQQGGQLTTTSDVENWPGEKKIMGPDLMKKLENQALSLGAELMEDLVERVDFSAYPFKIFTQEGKEIHALSVIIATGATPEKLGVPGEQEYWGAGVTTCAICDAPFYKGKDVVVVGGGDSAVEEAMQLAPHVKSVTILVRRQMRAAPRMRDHLKTYSNVKILFNRSIKEIVGNGDHVTGLVLNNSETKTTENMPIDGVFLAIGHKPNTDLFKSYLGMNDAGYLDLIGRTQSTTISGVFAAGDVEDAQYRQAGVAAGSGIKAALDAAAFLQDSGFNNDLAAALTTRSAGKKVEAARADEEVREISSTEEFDQLIAQSTIPVIADFYGTNCPPCKAMMPTLKAVANELAGKIMFVKVNVDDLEDLTTRYDVASVPTFLVFKKGALTDRVKGMMGKLPFTEFSQRMID